jgi:hypothetical protein
VTAGRLTPAFLKSWADAILAWKDVVALVVAILLTGGATIADAAAASPSAALEDAIREVEVAQRELAAMQGSLATELRDNVICTTTPAPYNCRLLAPNEDARSAALRSVRAGTSLVVTEDASHDGVSLLQEVDPASLAESLRLNIAAHMATAIQDIEVGAVLDTLTGSKYFGPDDDHAYARKVLSLHEKERVRSTLQFTPNLIERPSNLLTWSLRLGFFGGGLLLGVSGLLVGRRLLARRTTD